jgi:hypothetical protein
VSINIQEKEKAYPKHQEKRQGHATCDVHRASTAKLSTAMMKKITKITKKRVESTQRVTMHMHRSRAADDGC